MRNFKEIILDIIKETYQNAKEQDNSKYKKIQQKDFEEMAENIAESDELWNVLDNMIMEDLQKYIK